ncbi:MAG: hypothetical protein A3J79_00655 [Elusimicrobia bacterium RIFOXYB2_FULL_62_6]|nr:MAG: hypothetical protein A3J79_00655 [Elusimicrobia bacterium RIFOXYB2_FULL_62_6]
MELTSETCTLVFDALEQTHDTIFITDADGKIVYANRAFEDLTGFTRAESIGRNANILKSGEHTKDFYDKMWNTIRSGQAWSGRFINKRKDGTRYMEKVRISPLKNAKGKITHYISVRHDVTHELALENQLVQSQKMEALGLLAGQMAHDFNNMLTIIIGSMELVKEDLKEGTIGMKLTDDILKTSKDSANLIKQLLVFARRQDDEKAPPAADLNAAIKDSQTLARLLGPKIRMEYRLAPDLHRAKIAPEQLTQVLMNLALNAKDAMGGSGTITIATENFRGDPDGDRGLPAGDYAAVSVSDTGPGMPADIMEHVFEPFFTTKPKGKGTGLGLSIVYGIIKRLGGTILVASEPGRGAAFTIYLPKA